MTETYRQPTESQQAHPSDSFLRTDMFPTVWCPGCGIGTALYSFFEACREKGIASDRLRVISGAGCTGPIADCLKVPSHGVTEASPVAFAVELRERHPDLTIGVFLNNADLMRSGAADLRDAGRRRAPITVICVNNLVYAVSRKNASPLTPYMRKSSDGRFDLPFNLPAMACEYQAEYVARWTPLRAGWMKESLAAAFSKKKGFALIELISPCLLYDANTGRILDAVDRMKFYNDHSRICFQFPEDSLDLRRQQQLTLGVFRNGFEDDEGAQP